MTTYTELPSSVNVGSTPAVYADDVPFHEGGTGSFEVIAGENGIVKVEANANGAFNGSGYDRRHQLKLTAGNREKIMEGHTGGAGGGSGSSARDGFSMNLDWVIPNLVKGQRITVRWEITGVSGLEDRRFNACWLGL